MPRLYKQINIILLYYMNDKIEKRLNELGIWYDFDEDNILNIKMPVKVSNSGIKFRCPFCVSKYKNDFTRFKHSRSIDHKYARGDYNYENLGTRVPLCKKEAYFEYDLPPFQFSLIPVSTTLSFS